MNSDDSPQAKEVISGISTPQENQESEDQPAKWELVANESVDKIKKQKKQTIADELAELRKANDDIILRAEAMNAQYTSIKTKKPIGRSKAKLGTGIRAV